MCYLSKDKELVQKAVKEISEFEYKITYVEYPDEVVCDNESAQDIVESGDDVRLFLGVGGREIADLLCIACEKRSLLYAIITNSLHSSIDIIALKYFDYCAERNNCFPFYHLKIIFLFEA